MVRDLHGREWRGEKRANPKKIHAEIAEVFQTVDDTADIADAIAIPVHEGLGVDDVADRIVPEAFVIHVLEVNYARTIAIK